MNKDFFSDEIRNLGSWDLAMNSQVEILSYMLYLNEVKKLKDSGEWIKQESTFVLDQTYFSTSKTGEYFYNIAHNALRNKKLEQLIKKI